MAETNASLKQQVKDLEKQVEKLLQEKQQLIDAYSAVKRQLHTLKKGHFGFVENLE